MDGRRVAKREALAAEIAERLRRVCRLSSSARLLDLFPRASAALFIMPYRQHRLEPNYPGSEVVTLKSAAPPVVVKCWWLMVSTMDRVRLERFTRETRLKFDAKHLETLKWPTG